MDPYEEEFLFDGVSLSTRLLSGGHQGPERTGIPLRKHGPRDGSELASMRERPTIRPKHTFGSGQVAGGES